MLFISKSKYLSGLQCHKLLWFHYNAKDQIPAFDSQTQAIFDQGHRVGELAKSLFRGGIEIGRDVKDFGTILELSKEALTKRKPLFEAAFNSGNAYARADILNPVGENEWEIIEVKSSTEVKDINLQDLALQRYAYEGAGLAVSKCYILHINNEYVRKGDIEPRKLFMKVDVTEQVANLEKTVGPNLRTMAGVIALKRYPEVAIGPQCSNPYGCPLQEMCWKFLPEDNPTTLYRFKKEKAFDLIRQGKLDIRRLPGSIKLSEMQQIQVEALRKDKSHVDKKGIRGFLDQLEYPLYFLDFETFGTAIPLYDDVSPYQQVPFQYSLDIVEVEGKKPKHESFLAEGAEDPRPELLRRLKNSLGQKGSIVAYNASFEKDKLNKATELYDQYANWYSSVGRRFVDLLLPFKTFSYYHPDQHGSASIKAVLPALTGKSYQGLEIKEGGTASLEYLRVAFNEVSETERQRVRSNLETYCALDTQGMVEIVAELRKLSK